MSQPTGVGIVGYGKVASGAHQRWVIQREDANLSAVCDMTEVRRLHGRNPTQRHTRPVAGFDGTDRRHF